MTPSQAKYLAGEILEGDFALQHFFDEHFNLMRRLEGSILNPIGEVILLGGDSGCGITTLLRSLHLQHPEVTQILKGDIYLGYWDFIDHICDAFNIRRGDYSKRGVPANLLRVLSLTRRKVLLIDDLDIYIANQAELDQVFSIIGTLSIKLPGFTFVISTRNNKLVNRFVKFSQPNWWSHDIRQSITEDEYYDFATRLWGGLNEKYSLGISGISLIPPKPNYSLNLQKVNEMLRLQLVERFLQQQGFLDTLSSLNNLEEYEFYVQSILTT